MTGPKHNHPEIGGDRRIVAPLAACLFVIIIMAACILPVTGANATATATTTATTTTTTTATTSPTATATATHTTTATATSTTTATTTATTSATTTTTTASSSQAKPNAGFTADISSGLPPLDVQFTDLSTGGPVSWTWDFGDGSTSTDPNPSHTYDIAGSYTVTLTVVNRQGTSGVLSQPNYITVDEVTATPTETTTTTATTTESTTLAAKFSGSPLNGTSPLTVEFTDSSTGAPDEWSWDFGDDTTSSDQNPSHTYQNTGLYTVSLKISKSGDTDKTTKVSYITVSGDANSVGNGATDAGPTPTLMKKSQLSSTAIPTPIIRKTPVQANVTAVLTGQAWLDRENKKLADAEAAAASQHPDIVSQIVGFFRGIFSWI